MKTVVIEDSRIARNGLLNMLSVSHELQILGSAANAEEARDLIALHRPQLLFLDIQMPGDDGFQLLDSLDYDPYIIFTTAHAKYAVRSFDYQAIDYLLKPISQERLAISIAWALNHHQDQPSHSPLDYDSRVFIKDGDECHLIAVFDISYLESCKNHVRVFFSGKSAFVKKPLRQLECRLPSTLFFRASRQYIINLKHVATIEKSVDEGYEVTMKDSKVIHISRRNGIILGQRLTL